MPKIVQVKVDVESGGVEVAVDRTETLIRQLRDLKYSQQQLDVSTREGAAAFAELNVKILELNEQLEVNKVRNKSLFDQVGMLGGAFGETGAKVGETVSGLRILSAFRFEDLKSGLTFVGSTLSNIAKGFGEVTGITKLYTLSVEGLSTAFEGLGFSEEAAASAAKGLSGALIATGIGALIVGIGLLIANWDKLSDAITGSTEVSKAFEESQKEVTKQVADFDKKLYEVKESLQAAKEGTISKKEALKEYNDKLGETVGYAGSLEQAEKLLAENTEVVVEGIKLRAQAQIMYGKAAEYSAKIVSGEGMEPGFWQSTWDILKNFGSIGGTFKSIGKDISDNYNEAAEASKKLEAAVHDLTKAAIEYDRKLKKGLAENPKEA